MGLALDTVLGGVNVAGTTTTATALTDVTLAGGDSFGVRAYRPGTGARLTGVTVMAGSTSQQVRIKSPMLHDNVRGVTFTTTESPSVFAFPADVGQPIIPTDTLELQASAAASTATMAAMHNHYSDLPGVNARLKMWADIVGNIKSIKPVQVAVTTGAASNVWVDTAINATEDLLHANTDYAVLGYIADVNVGVIGVKGVDTGNLRACGPGSNGSRDMSDYFVYMSQRHQLPYIPIINSANKASTFVSVAANVLSTAANVTIILAEMVNNLPS